MTEIKVLTAEEMNALTDSQPVAWPHESLHIVAFDEKRKLVGSMSLISLVHIEGTWIHPDHRNTVLAIRLEKRAEEEAKKLGLTSLMSFQLKSQKEIADYLERLKFEEMPFTVWQKGI